MGYPKPEPIARVRRRRKRLDSAAEHMTREHCVERDGFCRIAQARLPGSTDIVVGDVGPCSGVSELMHLEDHRRFRTRGMTAEERHDPRFTAMGCTGHHHAYDAHRFGIEFLTHAGANGPLAFHERTPS